MIAKRTGFLVASVMVFILCGLPLSAAEPGNRVPRGPLVVSDTWPECTDLQTWIQDVMRLEGVENASETAQAKVFFRWLRLFSKMATGGMIQAHEGPYGQEQYVLDAHKNAFVYGWGFCDTHSRIAEAVWSEWKKDRGAAERVITLHEEGGYHTMFRLRLDGRYGAFDARYGYYLVEQDTPDSRILDWAEVGIDENVLKNKGYRHRSAPFFEFFGKEWDRALAVQPTYYETEDDWVRAGKPVECVFGNGQYEMGTRYHDMAFELPKGTVIERYWDNSARKFYVPAGYETKGEEPFLPSGRFYRVTETMFDGNWVKHDPNYAFAAPYVATVPTDEGYNPQVSGGKTIGQAWGRLTYDAPLKDADFLSNSPVTGDLVKQPSAPYLVPRDPEGGGHVVFDFYCPYVLADATLTGDWSASVADQPKIEIRTLLPKPKAESEPDQWTAWQTLSSSGGPFQLELGKPRFKPGQVSIHGAYRFQVRLSVGANSQRSSAVGLSGLHLKAWFENGIMSIPRLRPGKNTIHFKLQDASTVRSAVTVTYAYQAEGGEVKHEKRLQPNDFRSNIATYEIDAAGLKRCNWLRIEY